MKTFMSRYNSQVYALMRIVTGFLFLWHGAQKLFNFPSGMPGGVPAFIIYVAGPIEFFGGILIMIGLFTHWVAFITSGQMAVAYWMAHGTKALLPLQNNGELAVLYCFIFLFIATQGGGIWSIDALITRRKPHG
ncbi:MAG: DoxX family protein [Pelobacteraceae bacterium]